LIGLGHHNCGVQRTRNRKQGNVLDTALFCVNEVHTSSVFICGQFHTRSEQAIPSNLQLRTPKPVPDHYQTLAAFPIVRELPPG
jgi:hypothetical protein